MKEPISLDFTLTLACNNNCRFCPRSALEPIVATPARALAAIKKAGGCREAVLTGGEPTTLSSLPAIAAACRRAGALKTGMITNGRRLSDLRYLKKLVAAGVTGFTISLYSHLPAVHDRLTRAKGSCAQTWKGLRNALRVARGGSISAGVNMVLCAGNIGTAGTTLRLLKALGAGSVTLINLSGPAAAAEIFDYSALRALLAGLPRGRACPDRLLFRGFPLCLFPAGIAAENQDIEGAGGVPCARLLGYAGAFARAFVKPRALCAGCPETRHCNGLPGSYYRRYGLSGLK